MAFSLFIRLTVCPQSWEPQGKGLSDSLPGSGSGPHQRACAEQQSWELARAGGITGWLAHSSGLGLRVAGLPMPGLLEKAGKPPLLLLHPLLSNDSFTQQLLVHSYMCMLLYPHSIIGSFIHLLPHFFTIPL